MVYFVLDAWARGEEMGELGVTARPEGLGANGAESGEESGVDKAR